MDIRNRSALIKRTKGYRPSLKKSMWQILNTYPSILLIHYVNYHLFEHSFFLSLPLIFIIALFTVRLFCIQHDCGHGSFFSSKRANTLCGVFCSLITCLPYHYWRYNHAQHHINSGKLERRGQADFYILTKEEYLKMNKIARFKYRFLRSPFCLLLVAPIVLIIFNLMPYLDEPKYRNNIGSAVLTSLVIISIWLSLSFLIDFRYILMVFLPILYLTSVIGIWLFYIQHNFPGGYFKKEDEWTFGEASLLGSSYCVMPKIFQWFTASIGFHHIHHLNPSIPNYYLENCHVKNAEIFTCLKPFKLTASWKSLFINLWDSEKDEMISFHEATVEHLSDLRVS